MIERLLRIVFWHVWLIERAVDPDCPRLQGAGLLLLAWVWATALTLVLSSPFLVAVLA